MLAFPDLALVLKIMFCATVGTAGILLSLMAIPISLFLLIRYMKKSNKNTRGDSL